MGKDQDLIQAVKDNDSSSIHKILLKLGKGSKSKIIGNNKKLNVNFQDGDGMSALHQAALMGSTDVIKLLLDASATPDLRDNKGMVPLHYAAWQGRPEPVQALLQKQSPVNEQALNGETPLHLACQHGHIHVVKLLLTHHADPTICNKELKTPLDLACEFGRYRVVEQLLKSNLCEKLLEDSPIDTLDNGRTTCLHLAARNGHSDIIRLLIQSGMNINRATLNGTCLHEAALYGKTDVVRLLLDCGIDVNKPNSYDQTALDIVNKFTSTRAARELKQLLKEASFAVQARAVKDYFNLYDPQALAFKEGDIITVLEQRADGLWKGYVSHEGRMAKTGLFPSNHVVLVDSQALKVQHTKAPQVPDLLSGRAPYFQHNGHVPTHNGYSDTTSISSSSTDDSFPPPPHITNALGPPSSHPPHHAGYSHPPPASPGYYSTAANHFGSPLHHSAGGGPPASPGGYLPGSPAVPCSPHKDFHEGNSTNHSPSPYHSNHNQFFGSNKQQVSVQVHSPYPGLPGGGGEQHAEWGGVGAGAGPGGDMRAGSPGREHVQHNHSPAHSNRNSAASSDSGRGVSTGHLEPKVVTVVGQHRLSGQSYESGVSSRQSYHSTSSSSLGSLDRLEESGHASTINVHQLIQAGVPDKEVLHAWLHDLHFEDYYTNFVQAGYDMPTISRMTPEDLTAIGITKPAHRKRLKAEIARLNISDGIPDFCPHDMIEWLHLLGLGMYHETLASQGYDNIEYVTDITWEDLEEIGIKRLGHQKKIMLAIDRLKRIMSATKRLSTMEPRRSSIEMLEPPPPAPPIGRWSGEISALPPHMYEGGLGVGAKPKKSPSGDSISTTGSGGSGSNSSQGSGEVRAIPIPREDAGIAGGMPYNRQNSNNSGNYQTDMVAIQVKRQVRSSSSDEPQEVMSSQTVIYQSFQGTMGKGGSAEFPVPDPMSTSDPGVSAGSGPAGAPKVQPKPKPVAKIVAKTKRSSREYSPDSEMEKHESENNSDGQKTPPVMSRSPPVMPTTSVAAVAAMMERTGEVYTGGTLKRGAKGDVGKQLKVEITREHIYDQPQVSPSATQAPASPKPQVMPKPASPLHVATHHSPVAQPSGSPTGRSKKAPPPPPKRTHSIRNDAAPPPPVRQDSASGNSAPVFSVTTTATVSPSHSAASSTRNPPSVVKNTAPPPITSKPVAPPGVTAAPKQFQGPEVGASPRPQNAVVEKPQPQAVQTQAFASCVKSLSERFGKKSEIEGSQESLSSDSDDFPPPPPPIAMDIITPKIHNYGIPSKSDIHHVPPTVREYAMHGHHPPPSHGFQNRLKPLQASDSPLSRAEQQHSLAVASPIQRRVSPGRDVPASTLPQEKAKNGAETGSFSSSLVDKRSESTTSFESTASSSSTDSNTLPFANENVGTIKQRVATTKPSIVQTFESVDGQRSVDLNMSVFDNTSVNRTTNLSAADTNAYIANATTATDIGGNGGVGDVDMNRSATNSSAVNSPSVNRAKSGGRIGGEVEGNRTVAPGMPQSAAQKQPVASAVSRLAAGVPASVRLSQQTQGASPEGPYRPPVPGKKPTHVPVPPQQQQRPSASQQQDQQRQPQEQQQQQPAQQQQLAAKAEPAQAPVAAGADTRASGDVLSDIDNMLQDLTDELDAMLEETVG